MKRIFLFPVFLFLLISCHSQPPREGTEFTTNNNGLMYSESDMKTLRFIVDSLNLRFKSCPLDKVYQSQDQTRVYEIVFSSETNDLKAIMNDLATNPDFDELAAKYASLVQSQSKDELLVRSRNQKKETYFLQGSPGSGYERLYWLSEKKGFNDKNIKNKWIHEYSSKDRHSKSYRLYCRYIPGDWKTVAIPENYGRLIQYVDCMIDPSSVRSLTDLDDNGRSSNRLVVYDEINDYLNIAMKKKKNGKNDYEYEYISPEKFAYAKEYLKEDRRFINLVEKAAQECLEAKQSGEVLEDLIATFVSKETALQLKSRRRVIGTCSQDDSPRQHARSIALLAAEAHNWDIFLRAHLDIMNDRFERASDGSYAWGQRKTYLRELEELNLNIVDLMLGLTLRAQNIADNHYYGTIWRMGRALAESKEKDLFEAKAIAMMKDGSLDEFNRGLVFLLYSTYTYYFDKTEGKKKRDALRNTVDSFPDFMQGSIRDLKEPKEGNEG